MWKRLRDPAVSRSSCNHTSSTFHSPPCSLTSNLIINRHSAALCHRRQRRRWIPPRRTHSWPVTVTARTWSRWRTSVLNLTFLPVTFYRYSRRRRRQLTTSVNFRHHPHTRYKIPPLCLSSRRCRVAIPLQTGSRRQETVTMHVAILWVLAGLRHWRRQPSPAERPLRPPSSAVQTRASLAVHRSTFERLGLCSV